MTEHDPTRIGRVQHVLGSTVTVALDAEMAGVAPLWEGRLQPVGQVGSLVRVPQGPVSLLGSVVLVGISEIVGPTPPLSTTEIGNRWLQVQLLGEVDSLGRFQRGVTRYPGLDDAVHFVTPETLSAVFPGETGYRVRLGRLAAAPEFPVTLDAARLVNRHAAIVGSTGSGKTNAVAALVQRFLMTSWGSSNIVIIDPHGEYRAAFSTDTASYRSVLAAEEHRLLVPYWALPAIDILRALCGRSDSQTAVSRFSELVTEARQRYASNATWITTPPSEITSDTPTPFDINAVWYEWDKENRAVYTDKAGQGDLVVVQEGDPTTLSPIEFAQYGDGSTAPYKSPRFRVYSDYPDRLRRRLRDTRFAYFTQPSPPPYDQDPLPEIMNAWLGDERPVSLLDFSGVPGDVADLAIGVVLQLLFEVALRSRDDGVGRPRPVLIVLEEAHRYLASEHGARTARARLRTP